MMFARLHRRLIVEQRMLPAVARRRLLLTACSLMAVGAVGFAVVLIGVVTQTGFHRLDAPVEAWFNSVVSTGTTPFMIVLAVAFGPVALPVVIALAVVVWGIAARHLWRPLLLAGGMITGMLTALALAPVVQHPRPPVGLMLFGPDSTFSFPSGHVLGTADFLLITAYLLASRVRRTAFTVAAFATAILGIAAQIVSRLYLGYHWISDTAGSVTLSMIILGAVIAIDVWRTVRVRDDDSPASATPAHLPRRLDRI